MSDSSGCKLLVTALIVAMIMGGLGFVSGFVTHTILAADEPALAQITSTPSEIELGPRPSSTPIPPTAASESTPAQGSEPTTSPEPQPTIAIPPATGSEIDLFWEAWELIQRDFYGELPSPDELVFGAIRGAVGTLDDPFTAFIPPEAAEINRQDDSGSFEGIGAFVTMNDGRLEIVSTFEDQPADQAGLMRGDIVLQVDETPIENMSIYEAIDLIRGPAGTIVRLKVAREDTEPFEVEIERASIDIPVVESEMRSDGVGYVRLLDFSSDASVKLQDAVQELMAQDAKGIILDLRGNPGGWLNEAVLVSGLFLPRNELVLIERFKDGTERPYQSPEAPIAPDVNLVLLVDGGSASASEIVAGALQDHGRAVLIGEKTFGKGSVQWPHELSNGAEMRVTVARWFTPNDRAIHGEGLEPDITVELTREDVEADLDPQLERAVEYVLTGQ